MGQAMAIEVVEAIDSTSDELRRRVGAGLRGEAALLARRQTGGRGRLARLWDSPPGNLYLSLLLRPGPVRAPGHWALLVAVALAEAAAQHLPPSAPLRLKWPNDVLLGAGKLAGILIELDEDWLLVGCGVNLRVAPSGLGRPTAALIDHGADLTPEAFAEDLIARLQDWRRQYAQAGFDLVRRAWLERGPPLGAPIVANLGQTRLEGGFAGLDDDGALLLQTAAGRQRVVAGEIA